ncbi:monooxygenase [Paenibacillus pectinilyticus]|uniref:Monooxygenase n=1 Tax=Paenibacillus pectinilyticus TaxID=512399 RepID=A0A1C1A493_9BACL|nr:NAD(P)/FAD-dependent oxidoreductase [Paenibacillus pectinilyticus]OCT15382.1 monooxygenase [Paenibacillus pectinilyticus]
MTHTYDVAIIGGGIAGSVTAKALADQGWHTALFDRKAFPRHKVCGEFLSPETQTMFAKLGLHELMTSLQPSSIHRARLIPSRGKPLSIALPSEALGVSRCLLDTALHQTACRSGAELFTETAVTMVERNEHGYSLVTKQQGDRVDYQARAVIGAWGAHSFPSIQNQRTQIQGTHIGVKSHYTGIDMDPVVELYFFKGGYVGLSPIENGHVNVAGLLDKKFFLQTDKSILGFIDAACRKNSALSRKLALASPVLGTQAAVAPVQLTRKPLAWDKFPRLGDASMMLPPLCGDGMSMALRSAMICAPLASRYLQGEITLEAWELAYTQGIQKEFKGPLKWGHLLQSMLDVPLLPQFMLAAARFTPGLAGKFVQVTRLKEIEL